MSRGSLLKTLVLSAAMIGLSGLSAKAQDWSDYLHWPYTPPQTPGSGHEYKALYDGWYLYPKEQRIVPQPVVAATAAQFKACAMVGSASRSELHFEALKRLLDRSEADYAR